jgi:hypothetical protein
MARATAEAVERGVGLRVLSQVAPPPQWASWCTAASDLGVSASWTVADDGGPGAEVPVAGLAELAHASLVVTDARSLLQESDPALAASSLARRADVYVVASVDGPGRARTRRPAVVVGVPDVPDHGHLLEVAAREADHRRRNLILVHAQSASLEGPDHRREHRWLDELSVFEEPAAAPVPARVVVTHRSVVEALRDHVDGEDVLVVGVHAPGQAQHDLGPLLAAPPCDLLLTFVTGTAPDAGVRGPGHGLTSVRTADR